MNSVLCDIVCCNICGVKIISEDVSQRNGLVCNLSIKCVNCKSTKTFWTSEKSEKKNNLFDTNLRYYYGLRCIGKGYSAGRVLCGMLNLSNPPTNTIRYTSLVGSSVKTFAEKSMKAATREAVVENEGNSDIAISFDGSWQKRGFQSKNSCASAISVDNGKVVDVEVVGMSALELGVLDAVITFNDGYSGRLQVLEDLGLQIGFNTMKSMTALDKERIKKAEIAVSNMTKEARSKRRRAALGDQDREKDEDYQPGGF